MNTLVKRIGIYSGTFDPFHKGHLAFCLEVLRQCALDKVYIIPEARPRSKTNIGSSASRTKTIQRMIRDHSSLGVVHIDHEQFTVKDTLPILQKRFPNAELTLLVGSDVAEHMIHWPNISQLLEMTHLAIGLRRDSTSYDIEQVMSDLEAFSNTPIRYTCVITAHPFITSSCIKHLGRVAHSLAVDFSV